MIRSASERIHIYVWPERFLYLGPSTTTSMHRNHAATWLVAEHGRLSVTLDTGEVLENEVVFIPAETDYATAQVAAGIAAFYWEPESASYQRAMQHAPSTPRGFECKHRHDVEQLRQAEATQDDADQLLAQIFGLPSFGGQLFAYSDARVTAALSFLRESPQDYGSIEALAARVHLSPSRFAHVFKKVVGVPVRRYVLWTKMRRALDYAIAGQSLTAAALSAGFADSAHLSRSVRSMIGVAPEFLFKHRERLVIHH